MNAAAPGASLVHSVIAAALADPPRLRGWAADVTVLESLGIDPTTIDIEALSKFAGLGEKVRHNLTRAMLPMTFRLLTLLGQDIDLFGAYALSSRNPGRGTPPIDRVDALASFVDDWAGSDPDRTLIRDMCRHEHALARLRAIEAEPQERPVPASRAELAPRGELLLCELASDPRQLVQVLRDQCPRLDTVDRGSWTFVYQREPDAAIRVLQIDPAVGDLLRLLDEGISLIALAEQLRHQADDPALHAALDQLADVGLLTWRG